VLGKHTDYAGGRSLTCASRQGFSLVAVPRDDSRLVIVDVGRGQDLELEISSELSPEASNWARYPRAVARRLARDFGGEPGIRGADVALTSDLPSAAGMSSSSALTIALFEALAAVNTLERRDEYRAELSLRTSLAGYLGAVESGAAYGPFAADFGVGTTGGSEDHTAILCSQPAHLGRFSYAPVRAERSIEAPKDRLFAVATSGVRARKGGEARESYNRAARLASIAAGIWRRTTGGSEEHLGAVAEGSPEALGRLLEAIPADGAEGHPAVELANRVDHFRQESEYLVPRAGEALERGDLAVFGLLVDRSQHLAERLLGNQIPETSALAEGARELGADAASAFGAGFGGAVWALVEAEGAEEFAEEWLAHYLEAFPERSEWATVLVTEAAGPAREVSCS
jgi:galactokinase